MKVGAEPKKMAILGGLLLVAGYFLISNWTSGPPTASTPATPARQATSAPSPAPQASRAPEAESGAEVGRPVPRSTVRGSDRSRALQEFRPSLVRRRAGEKQDTGEIDPTLRTDLLAKLEKVPATDQARNLFEFSAEPLPKTPEPKIIPKQGSTHAKIGELSGIGPDTGKGAEAAIRRAPPIPLKFFGYTMEDQTKRAFFLAGDEILIGAEGEIVKKRYKVVRIGVSSAVVEDVESKSEQTLKLEAEAG
ncbi:MAG: hypothetical protein ABFD60_07585 [Bryobacteraceae bacterium]